jgi:hypothetical protein
MLKEEMMMNLALLCEEMRLHGDELHGYYHRRYHD